MSDQPAILIQFDPQTWKPTGVFFLASTDVETKHLQEILREGLNTETLISNGNRNDA